MDLKKTGDGGGQCVPKLEELLLAWMHPGLEHSGNSQRIRFLFLKEPWIGNYHKRQPQYEIH
jgi:hypothetical protein